jgi:4'-phosphopantetheinyl transferase
MNSPFDPGVRTRPLSDRAQRIALAAADPSMDAWIGLVVTRDLAEVQHERFLSSAERSQAAAYAFARRRESFVLGRLAAKLALGAYLAEPDWSRIELRRGVLGQPLANHSGPWRAEVSLSHTDGLAAAIAFPRELSAGIDVEIVDAARADTVRNELRFHPAEEQWLHAAALETRSAHVMLWTVREALGKALRCGLGCPLELLAASEIRPLPGGAWESRYSNFPQYRCLSWIDTARILSLALGCGPQTPPLPRG